jgi:hypothetical protein
MAFSVTASAPAISAGMRCCSHGERWRHRRAVTAYQYDWNMLPIGQALWLKELQTHVHFPPLQNPASYNLEQVIQQVREMTSALARC